MLTQKDIDKSLKTLKGIGIDEATIDSEAATILHSASLAVKAILAKREQLDQEGRQNEPLIVLAGENHTFPSNYAHHIRVLTKLKKTEPTTSLAIEYPHDTLRKVYAQFSGKPLSSIKKSLVVNDNDTTLYKYADKPSQATPYSVSTLYHSCLQDQIDIKFTDASRYKNEDLDLKDPSTVESVKGCFDGIIPSRLMSLTEPPGMWVRNHHMAKTAMNYAKQTGTRIIVQQTGVFHLAGIHEGHPDQSLSAEAKKAGAPILAYYLAHQNEYAPAITKDAAITKDELLFLPPLPERQALYKTHIFNKLARYHTGKSELNSHKKESAYLNAILSKMGAGQYGLNTRSYIDMRQSRKNEFIKRLKL